MKLPKIDLSSLPDLNTLTGMFGSIADPGSPSDPGPYTPGHDDTIIVLASIVYETTPPGSGLF